MKEEEPDFLYDQLIDEAIADDLKQQPDIFYVQKVMSNIYSISKGKDFSMYAESKHNFSFRLAITYGLSIAASICIGYFIGSINISPSDSTMILVNFENINMNSLIAF